LKVSPLIPFLFLAFLFSACSNRPSNVLSDTKMEKVLYDIYIAEAEININYPVFSSDSTRKQELLNSVLKKHKITEAVLDTSLAWYSGRLEKYFKINENVNKRFTETLDKLKKSEGISTKPRTISANQMALPVGKENFLLKSSDLQNNAYTYKADTALNRYGGSYDLRFTVLGLSASLRPVVTLCIQCPDTAFVKRDTLSQNGLVVASLDIPQGKLAKKLYGSIYFPEANPQMTVFIKDFTLTHTFHSNLPVTQPPK